MSNQILKKLRREARANPKKAGILGVLIAVALYFWAPLIRQWAAPGENAAKSAVAASKTPLASASPAPSGPAVAATAPAQATFDWRGMAAAIDRDPQMKPATPEQEPNATRDPFVAPRPKVVQEVAPETDERVNEAKTPGELGLVLSGTIVGAARRTAVVNGRIYRLGRELKAADGMVFVVRQIEPWGIVLERSGRRFELELPKPSP